MLLKRLKKFYEMVDISRINDIIRGTAASLTPDSLRSFKLGLSDSFMQFQGIRYEREHTIRPSNSWLTEKGNQEELYTIPHAGSFDARTFIAGLLPSFFYNSIEFISLCLEQAASRNEVCRNDKL
jgi:hypothetical protein